MTKMYAIINILTFIDWGMFFVGPPNSSSYEAASVW